MNYKVALVEAGKAMIRKNLTVETWGNLSLRDPETGQVYLTPSGMPYHSIISADVVVTDLSGAILEGTRRPTVEASLHQSIYRARPDVHAVIHTHPVWSLVFAVQRRDIPPITDEAAQILGGAVRCTEYALPGSEELARNAVNALGESSMACLLANHGAVCLGRDMDEAFRTATVLEMTAQIYHLALVSGTPQILQDESVAYMRDFMLHQYGQRK